MKKEEKKHEKYNGVVKIMTIGLVMAMLAYTATLCLQKDNKYSKGLNKHYELEDNKTYTKTK